jgi:hypothetical protein
MIVQDPPKGPRRFYLERIIDTAGVSGTGRVLDGVIFDSGQCVAVWRKPVSNVCVFASFDDFTGIFLIGEGSKIVWLDGGA